MGVTALTDTVTAVQVYGMDPGNSRYDATNTSRKDRNTRIECRTKGAVIYSVAHSQGPQIRKTDCAHMAKMQTEQPRIFLDSGNIGMHNERD